MHYHNYYEILLTATALLVGIEAKPRIHFSDITGELKILVFSDLHYGEAADKDLRSYVFQRILIEAEKPDLVVFNGDAYSDYSAPKCCEVEGDCTEWFETQWRRFTAVVRELQIPYAFVLGNHDHFRPGLKPDGKDVIAYDTSRSRWSLSRRSPSGVSGGSVYNIPVYENSTAGGRPTAVLWILDSGRLNCMGLKGWGCVQEDQTQWFESQAESSEFKGVQGLMFVHIPLQEVLLYWNLYNESSGHIVGGKYESVCCSSANTGLFAAALSHSVSGIFHGHDHNNDFLARIDTTSQTIHVGYGRKSGYGGYGGVIADKPGARVIVMKLDKDRRSYTWNTYIRLENNSTVHEAVQSQRSLQSHRNIQGYCSDMA